MGQLVYGTAGYNGSSLSDQLDISPANIGATQVNKLGSGAVAKWVASTAFGGAWANTYTNAASNAANSRLPFDTSSYTAAIIKDFVMPALPTDANNLTIQTFRSASKVVLFQVDQTGKATVLVGSTAIQYPWTKPGGGTMDPLVAGNKYRVEIYLNGTTASVGTGNVNARIYAYGADTATYLGQGTTTSAALGTDPWTAGDSGLGSYATVRTITESNVRYITGVTDWQGPYTATTPPFDFDLVVNPQAGSRPLTVNVSCARVSGTGTGTNSAFSIDWGDGTSSSPTSVTGTTAATFTHVYNPSADTDFTLSATGTLT